MNISCQNSAYVGRTHLSQDDTIHKLLQAEIDTTNSNLDITNFNLDTLQTNYEITSNYIDSSLTPLTYLINSEITPGTSIPLMPDLTHTYIYNSNILGDIRFWVKSTTDFPVQFPIGVPDYRVKIDVDGKLKLYYTYDSSINLTWGNGWIDVANMIIGAVADSANQGVELTVLEGQILAVNTILSNKIAALVTAIDAILAENACLINTPAQAADLNGLMEIAETSITTKDAKSALSSAYTNLKQFSLTRNFNFLSLAASDIRGFLLNNPLTAFTVGVGGVAVGIAYGIIQNNLTTNYINQIMLKAISNNSNLTGTSELQEYASNVLMTSNIFDYLQLNYQLQESQGFINGNISTTQFIPEIHTSNIGIGLVSSNYELNIVGKINADHYYRSEIQQFIGTETENCNLSLSQGFINSNILKTQTIPEIYTNKIGIGMTQSSFQLDVDGDINANYYYSYGFQQFMGTETQHCNLSLSKGFINSNITTTQTIPSIATNFINIYKNNYTNPILALDAGILNSTTQMARSIGQPLLKIGGSSYSTAPGDYYGISFGKSPDITSKSPCEIGCVTINTTGTTIADLVFSTRGLPNNIPATERMRITYDGRVGIGKEVPAYRLDILGDFNFTTNIYKNGTAQFIGTETQNSNLTRSQGFINSNILTTQTIPIIYGSKIGLGITPSTYELDVVGKINADFYYRSDVQQFMGTETQNCNLSLSQGFINSNVLTTQTIPEIYGNKIGLGIIPSTFELDVVGTINADFYYRSDVQQFMGTETQHSNLTLSQGFINCNVLSQQFVKDIKLNSLLIEAASGLYSGGGRIDFNNTAGFKAKIGVNSASDQHITGSSTGDIVFRTMDTTNKLHFSATTRPQLTLATNNKIGIQTATPRYNFDICNDPLLLNYNAFSISDTVLRVQRQGITTVRGNVSSPVIATFSRFGIADYIAICQDGLMANGVSSNYNLNIQAKGTGTLYLRTNDADIITIEPTLTTIQNNISLSSTASTEIAFSGYGVSLLGLNGGANSYAANTDAGDMVLRANTSKKIHLVSGLANPSLTVSGANVGIGRNDPQVLLHANGIIRARTGNQAYVEMCSSDSAQTGYLNFTNSSGTIKAMFGFETGDYLNLNTYDTCLGLANSGELVSTGTIYANGGIDAHYVSTNNTVSCGLLIATNITTSAPQIFKRFSYFLNMTSMGGNPVSYYANIDISNIEMIAGNPSSISIRVLEVVIYGQNGGIAIGEVCFIGYVFLRSNAFYYFTQTVLSDSCNFVPTSFQNLFFSTPNSQPCICVIRALHY